MFNKNAKYVHVSEPNTSHCGPGSGPIWHFYEAEEKAVIFTAATFCKYDMSRKNFP